MLHDVCHTPAKQLKIIIALFLPLFLLLFACPSIALEEVNRTKDLKWVDVHAHLVGGKGVASDYKGAVRAALSEMNKAGIWRSIIMPPPQVHGQFSKHDYEIFIDEIKRYGDRFVFLAGGGSLNPMIHGAYDGKVSPEMKRDFEEKAREPISTGAVGFGEITAHHLSHMSGHPYESIPADHPLALLLVDIAAGYDVVVDFHFDPVVEDMSLPKRFSSPPNPSILRSNMAAFERLLAHNRKARIVWAHAGSDQIGHWTVDLSRELLRKHPNLYMSLRMAGGVPWNRPLDESSVIKPEWLKLFQEFPDRFVIGTDSFYASPNVMGSGPGMVFSRKTMSREGSKTLLTALPFDLAQKIGYENAIRIYRLKGGR